MGREFKSRGELKSGERYQSGQLGGAKGMAQRTSEFHADRAEQHYQKAIASGDDPKNPVARAHTAAAEAHEKAAAMHGKLENAETRGAANRYGQKADELSVHASKLSQAANATRSAKIPVNDPFHKPAMAKMASDAKGYIPGKADEHIAIREQHRAQAKATNDPGLKAAHEAAAAAHEKAAGHAAGNDDVKQYGAAAAHAQSLSKAANDRGAQTALSREHKGPSTYEEHAKQGQYHREMAHAAMNPSERDAHHAAASLHEQAAEHIRKGTATASTVKSTVDSARAASKQAEWETTTRKQVTAAFVSGAQGRGNPHPGTTGGNAGHELGEAMHRAGMLKDREKPSLQTGPRGGVHYITKGGTKIYGRRW